MATRRFDNPFHDLWVTENLDSASFVKMFSDVLVRDAEALFSTGNIVLKGRQGSGKSMLLTLLETSTRIAYFTEGVDYPIPSKQCHFISAGVHLTQQSTSLVAARANEYAPERRGLMVAANFADYLNVLLCKDLLKNVKQIYDAQSADKRVLPEVLVDLGRAKQTSLFKLLSGQQSWRGVLPSGCQSIAQAIEALDERIRQHRLYANGIIEELPNNVLISRADAGIPVAELAATLRASKVISKDILILLRIDQHEELFELERHSGLGAVFRRVLNSALARRDPRIAYRIGTRHYAWEADLSAWGSGAPLEEERDYSVIDLDFILRRGEQSLGWKFPALSKDVLNRRLQIAGFEPCNDPMRKLFGRALDPKEKARLYAKGVRPMLKSEPSWAPEWKQYLVKLWKNGEPLDAKFGDAWLRQKSQIRTGIYRDGNAATGMPWRRSQWWAKERNEIALVQLAGDRQQALIWSGDKQIVDLAGNNILAFMTICKIVWATWQRRNSDDAGTVSEELPTFSVDDQVIGINEASHIWFKKIQVGFEADRRAKLVSALGSWFRSRMLKDRRLAYPGHNGFSLEEKDLLLDNDLIRLIKVCRDHGDLMESPHTTRNRSQERRVKWYLHPLLCPIFRIPHVRTKEPIYSSIEELERVVAQKNRPSMQLEEDFEKGLVPQLGLPGF